MSRQFLTGAITGAALVSVPTLAGYFFVRNGNQLYLRIAEDSPMMAVDQDRPEHGPKGAAIIRHCGISRFQFDGVRNVHTASSFLKLADASTAQLNCVVGQSRAQHLGLAFSDEMDTSEFYDLSGDPVAYTRCEPAALIAGTCQAKKN